MSPRILHACMHIYVYVCVCVCMASKANRAWGHPKRLRRRIQLSTHMYVCEFAWIRLHTRWYVCACVCVSIIAQQVNYQNQINVYMCQCKCSLCLCLRTYIHTYIRIAARVCVCAFHLLCTRCACFFVFCEAIWNVQKIAQQDTYLYGQ